MAISRKPDEFAPAIYVYMPDDTDRDIQLFSAKGKITVQMQCTLTESNAEILLLMPNILEWGYDKINLFELHIKSDTVIINYTTTEGKQRDFKFPLAGFKEKYLEQFI